MYVKHRSYLLNFSQGAGRGGDENASFKTKGNTEPLYIQRRSRGGAAIVQTESGTKDTPISPARGEWERGENAFRGG